MMEVAVSMTVSICWVPMSVLVDRATLLWWMVSLAMVCSIIKMYFEMTYIDMI